MKTKKAICFAFIVLFAPLFSGCICSHAVTNRMNESYWDTFNPSVVYRKDNPVSFALEGTRQNRGESFHAFLIVPEDLLAGHSLQTNETLSLEELNKMYDRDYVHQTTYYQQTTTRKTPPDYVRVGDLPKNDLNIVVELHYPKSSWVFLLPPAFVADLVLFPFQCIYRCGSATFRWGSEMFASHTDPIPGWKAVREIGCKVGEMSAEIAPITGYKEISDDVQKFVNKLPVDHFSQDMGGGTRRWCYWIHDMKFYEDGTGQHAVGFQIPHDGTWWVYVLIYDKANKRMKAVRYVQGHYSC